MLEQEPRVGAGSQSLDTDRIHEDKPIVAMPIGAGGWNWGVPRTNVIPRVCSQSRSSLWNCCTRCTSCSRPLVIPILNIPCISPAAPTALPAPMTLPAKEVFLRQAAKTSNSFCPLGNSTPWSKALLCPGSHLPWEFCAGLGQGQGALKRLKSINLKLAQCQ